MIIMSEILNKKFDTPEQCLAEEKAYLEKKAAEEAEKATAIEDVKGLILAAADAVGAADAALDKAANAFFDYRVKHGSGEINIECNQEDGERIGRTINMICRLCDRIELKRHAEMQGGE